MSIIDKITSIIKVIKTHAFELESVNKDGKTGLLYCMVKIGGKCVPSMRIDPLDLVKDGKIVKCISEDDFNKVIEALLENQKIIIENKYKKKYTLIKHQFSEQLEEPLVVYSDSLNKIYIKPAKDIYSALEKIKQFSSEDSACIGNIVGCSETEKEYKFRNANKLANNVIRFDNSVLSC